MNAKKEEMDNSDKQCYQLRNTSFSTQQEHQRLARCHYAARNSSSVDSTATMQVQVIRQCVHTNSPMGFKISND
jgi:hypothetical protein